MWLAVALSVLLVLAVPLWLGLKRANELFRVRLMGGEAKLVRGRLPPALMSEIEDVARLNPGVSADVSVVVESGEPRLVAKSALSPGTEQQLRNVVGRFRVVQIRAGSRRA